MRNLILCLFVLLANSSFGSIYHQLSLKKRKTIRAAHSMEIMGKNYYLKSGLTRYRGTNKFFIQQFNEIVEKRLGKKQKKFSYEIYNAILDASAKYEFDPLFLTAVISTESSFKVFATGNDKEIGLMQLMPSTARWLARKNSIKIKSDEDFYQPKINIALGAYYLHLLRDKFNENGKHYIAAYNIGPGKMKKKIRRKQKPKVYIGKVMKHYLALYKNIKSDSKYK